MLSAVTVRRFEPVLLLAWSMVTAALVFGDFHHPVRTAISLAFLAVVPGLALLRLIGLREPEMTILLVVPVSLASDAVVSAVLVYAGLPSWNLGLSILLSITIGAVIYDVTRPATRAQPTRTVGGKLDDEARQADVIRVLLAGGSLAEAAEAAKVSLSTLQRAIRRSPALRSAVLVASRGTVAVEDEGARRKPALPA